MRYYTLIYDNQGLLEGFETPLEVIPPRFRKRLQRQGVARSGQKLFLNEKKMRKFLKNIKKSRFLYHW